MTIMRLFLTCLPILSLAACSSDDNAADKQDTSQDLNQDASQDISEDDLLPQDQSQSDSLQDIAPSDIVGPFGFPIRLPKQDHKIECDGESFDGSTAYFEGPDSDFVCTFSYDGQQGHVYIQATPVTCTMMWGPIPEYSVKAWLSDLQEQVVPLENPGYDYGGNHRNDSLWFSFDGKKLTYDHSSFGFGWRACQPMDCMRISTSDGATVLQDGCTMERTIPVTCVAVEPDGTVPELLDNFEPCAGDPNFRQE